MAEEFTGHNFEEFEKFMNKNINLLNEGEYNIKSILYNLNLYEKEEKQKQLLEKKRNRETDPKEKEEEEEEEIKSLDFDSDIEEKSTKQETKGQQENVNQRVFRHPLISQKQMNIDLIICLVQMMNYQNLFHKQNKIKKN